MNAMTEALVQAGVKLPPVKERLWRHIKNNPGITRAELRKVFSAIPEGTFTGQLWMLLQSGTVFTRTEYINDKKRDRLYTDLDVYVRPTVRRSAEEDKQPAAPAYAPPAGQCDTVSQRPSPDALLDSLTIGEARVLYQKLKKMFGNQP